MAIWEAVCATATSYDYKLWYLDAQGREVIVGWSKARSDASSVLEGRSQTVVAREVDASTRPGVTRPEARGQVPQMDIF